MMGAAIPQIADGVHVGAESIPLQGMLFGDASGDILIEGQFQNTGYMTE